MEQRKANQEEAAKLTAAGAAGKFSENHPGLLGKAVTGGDPGQVAVQKAALIDRHAGNMKTLGVGDGDLRMIALGKSSELKSRGFDKEAALAGDTHAQQAAAKILAQKGKWDDTMFDKHKSTGYQAFMADVDPLMAAKSSDETMRPEAIDNMVKNLESRDPNSNKEVYWSRLNHARLHGSPEERSVATKAFQAVNEASASANIEHNGRHVIANQADRDAFEEGIRAVGNPKAQASLVTQHAENIRKIGGETPRRSGGGTSSRGGGTSGGGTPSSSGPGTTGRPSAGPRAPRSERGVDLPPERRTRDEDREDRT
jgi:hypothetical protein